MKSSILIFAVAAVGLLGTGAARAQLNVPSTSPGSPNGFNYPMSMEAVNADPKNHHVLYEDAHVRLLEVTLWTGDKELMHGHAYPSVFADDAVQPKMTNQALEPGETAPPFGKPVQPPGAPPYPHCMTMAPQNPHAATILDPFPQHFYRLEFKRLDGDSGLAENWRTMYPQSVGPDRVLFHNPHVRLVEVTLRPGETARLRGSPYSAVLAYDTPAPGAPGGPTLDVRAAGSNGSLAAEGEHQHAEHPPGWNYPTCESMGPVGPRQVSNTGHMPLHYYRIDFTRVDGAQFATRWKSWYPSMAKGPPQAAVGR